MGGRETKQQHARHLDRHNPLGHRLEIWHGQQRNEKNRGSSKRNDGSQPRKSLHFNRTPCGHSPN